MDSTPNPIQIELDRVKHALREAEPGDQFMQLYVAQQALSWALDPTCFDAPLAVIERGAVWKSARLDDQSQQPANETVIAKAEPAGAESPA